MDKYSPYSHSGVTDLDLIKSCGKTDKQLDQAIFNPVVGRKMEMDVMSELDYTIGLSECKRIIRLGRIKDTKKLRSHLRRLHLKSGNLEESTDQTLKDLYILKC